MKGKLVSKNDSKEEIEQTDEQKKIPVTGILELFQFAERFDWFLMLVGTLSSLGTGAAYPLSCLSLGNAMGALYNHGMIEKLLDDNTHFMDSVGLTKDDVFKHPKIFGKLCPDLDQFLNTSNNCADMEFGDSLTKELKKYVFEFIGIGVLVIGFGLGQVICWYQAGERQTYRIRYELFKNILRQDIGWFDLHDPSQLNSRFANDIGRIHRGIGETFGAVLQHTTCFTTGFVLAFVKGGRLATVLSCSAPVMLLSGTMFSYFSVTLTTREQTAYAKAGAIAEEVLSSIRTVVAFGGEEKEAERYAQHLWEAEKCGQRKGLTHGFTLGFFKLLSYLTYALGFWYGGKLIREDGYDVEAVLTVFFAISIGVFSLCSMAPGIQNLTEARGAAYTVFQLIAVKSEIDSLSSWGKRPDYVRGHIQFVDVHFHYPSRVEYQVLNGLNLEAHPGQTVALVGSSGCGKSTLTQLMLKFYHQQHGQILLDGIDMRDMNTKWLRQNIGLVSQEPVLFDTSIAENIRHGNNDVTMEDIVQAARAANAYDFISELPDTFDTLVGENGAQISGGQKQRIAIARALVKDPVILLLDEATSALDTESESAVQDALDKARQGRTTLVIAHRLSTIRTADIIVGIENGVVKEKGTHDQLMAIQGIYYNLVMNQIKRDDDECAEGEVVEQGGKPSTNVPDNGIALQRSCLDPANIGQDADLSQTGLDDQEGKVDMTRLLRLNANEWPYLAFGCLTAALFGGTQPVFSRVFSNIISVFDENFDEQETQLKKWCLVLVGVGCVCMTFCICQSWMFSLAGEALTKRLRLESFRTMLRQEMTWFDRPVNSTGALINKLNNDASKVQQASGTQLGLKLQYMFSVGGSVILSLYYGWQLSLVSFCLYPILLLGSKMQMRALGGSLGCSANALEAAGEVATQAIQNIRTVAALCREEYFLEKFAEKLRDMMKTSNKGARYHAVMFAIAQSFIYFSNAIIFAYGSYLIEEETMTIDDMLTVFSCFIFCGLFIGQISAFGPDMSRAKVASKRIFALLDRQSEIDAFSSDGKMLDKESLACSIKFQDAQFEYRTRPNVQVLGGVEFSVDSGQTVALVGSSGCGKSTIVSLLERFYNLENGTVTFNGHDIKDLNVKWLRSQMGLVSQEPVLFDRSISDNIAYGDNSQSVSMEDVIRVSRAANIHKFVQALPQGYETIVGDKGIQLSGGQKQRISIARALIRNPKLLLLDEATSAMDTESEKIVQEALDKARAGRTCITIAHRLSTIQDADKIVVIHQGMVVEQGTHSELMAAKGAYFKLQSVQNVDAAMNYPE